MGNRSPILAAKINRRVSKKVHKYLNGYDEGKI